MTALACGSGCGVRRPLLVLVLVLEFGHVKKVPDTFFLVWEGVEEHLIVVTPAKAGVPKLLMPMDSRLRGNDCEVEIPH